MKLIEMQYYSHLCICGCGGQIEIKKMHKYHGMPKYIKNHDKIKHGGKGTRLYRIWMGMKDRCLIVNNKAYSNYGGRGITICNEWLDFIPFRDWSLANGYADNLTIDRNPNPNKGYEPSNCQWIPGKENSRKQRTNKIKSMKEANEIRALYNTGNHTQKELAERYDVRQSQISRIINNKNWVN